MTDRGASELAIDCRDLVKVYGSGNTAVAALRGIDLWVAPGEVVMLTGPSGCGKTTLLSVIATLLEADSGICRILGHDMAEMSKSARTDLRAASIGFVFQSFNLLPALTAAENVSIPLILAGVKRSIAEREARDALESVGLADKVESLPGKLSGGQQQRVAIARAIVHRPAIILCDEPTSALDHDSGQQVMAVLCAAARDRAATLVIVTHDLRITPFADRIVTMEDGTVIDTPTIEVLVQ